MRRFLPLVALVFFAACATDTTGVSSRTLRPPKGNENATILVEEFADFQCSACRSAVELVSVPLVQKYGRDIRFEFKHFPLRQIHPHALEAAEAAECAADQDKFWEFHDMVYANQNQLSSSQLREWVSDLKMDSELFERCMKSRLKRKIVIADYQEGLKRGVQGTPTFFVNGEQVPSTIDGVSVAVDRALGATNLPL